MCKEFSWSRQYAARRAAAAQFGSIYDLPIVRRVRDVLRAHVRTGDDVLEVGAGDRRMEQFLRARGVDVRYVSCDVDPQTPHDVRSLHASLGDFACVCAFETIEHLPIAEIPAWLEQLAAHIRPGGLLLLSTPNTFCPSAYLRDATHQTPLCYDELAGLVASAGLRVTFLARVYHEAIHRKFVRRYLCGWLFRLLGLDFARQIVLVAQKPSAGAAGPGATS